MDFKFILAFLILILILAVVSFSFMQETSDINETSDDVEYIWMEYDDGSVKLIPTTDTYFEGSASAPG
jgi:hypothetical protein